MLPPIKKIRRYEPILDEIRDIINELYDDPKYKKYSGMRRAKVADNGVSIEYTKYQGWDDEDSDPGKSKASQEFQKELLDRIQDQLSDDLKKHKIKIIEDDDFCLFVKEN